MSKYKISVAIFLLALFVLAGPDVYANTGDKYSMNINISGTVVANGSCTFNQGGTLQVDFQEVKLRASGTNTVELDGNYIKPLVSAFTCTGDTQGLLQMKFTSASGNYETFNGTQVLGTNKGIVGVELLVDGAAQNMGEWFTVNQSSQPTMEAKLVQVSTTNSNNVVSGEVFTASGTLLLAFN